MENLWPGQERHLLLLKDPGRSQNRGRDQAPHARAPGARRRTHPTPSSTAPPHSHPPLHWARSQPHPQCHYTPQACDAVLSRHKLSQPTWPRRVTSFPLGKLPNALGVSIAGPARPNILITPVLHPDPVSSFCCLSWLELRASPTDKGSSTATALGRAHDIIPTFQMRKQGTGKWGTSPRPHNWQVRPRS